MSSLGPGSVLRRASGIAWRLIEGEAVLVDVRKDEVAHLNPTASFLWSRLDGERDLRDIAREMTSRYEVDEETALADLVDFAVQLLQQGLVEEVDEANH